MAKTNRFKNAKGKRWFWIMALMGLTILVTGPIIAAPQKITVLIHPTLYEAAGGGGEQGIIPQFSKRTGIQVEVVTAPSSDLREKELIEFMARSGRYDVAFQLSSWMNDDLYQYLEPLDSYVAKAGKDYDFKDFVRSLVESNRGSDGKLRAIPFRVGTAMLYYNKTMLANKGIKVPENWDQFLDAAQKLTVTDEKGKTKVYGVVQTLYPDNKDYIRVLYAMGGLVLNEKMTKCNLNTSAAKKMVNLFRTLYSGGYMPKEVLAWDRDPQITAIQQGWAAMGIFYSPYWGRLIDPKSTRIADQIGWALVPTSPGVPKGRSLNDGWSISIDKNSRNKAAAWELIKELTNKENQLIMAMKYANGPIRSSVYQSNEYLAEFPLAKDWLKATSASLFAPPHAHFAEIQDIMNREITYVLLGKESTEEALVNATKRINGLL
jgi:multiple sugar transport system substrate-binding protein